MGRAAADQRTTRDGAQCPAGTAIVDFFVGARYPRGGREYVRDESGGFRGEYSETCSRRAAVTQEQQQAAIKAPAKWCQIEESRAKEIAAT